MSLWDDMDMNSRANADASIPDVDMDVEPLMHPHQHPDGSHGADAFDGLPNDTVAPASVTSSSTNSNSNANPNAAANGADEASTKRPYACNPCRERKVRCDREQPTCGRCVRRGHGCTYSGPSKQSITKLDLSRLLLNLQDRLSYAESQGVFRQPRPTVSPQPTDAHLSWPDLGNVGLLPAVSPLVEPMPGQDYWQAVPVPTTQQLDMTGAPLNMHSQAAMSRSMLSYATTSITPPTIDWPYMDPSNASTDDFSSSLDSSELAVPPLMTHRHSPDVLSKLHNVYFDVFDAIMPTINRERFQMELLRTPGSMQVQALSQAMATLGAIAAPELGHTTDVSYAQTRTLLEMCERQENGVTLNSINTLQACVLLGFYELRQPNFARAWLTLGRGIRLSKVMGFMGPRTLNPVSPDPRIRHSSASVSPMPDAQDAEERRRTVWLLYILDAFAVMRTEWDPNFEEVTLPLPSPGDLCDVTQDTVMPTIQEAFESNDTHTISTFGGLACVISMYRQCFNHIHTSQQDPSYAFWDNYYRIDKLVSKCSLCFRAQHVEPVSFSPTEPLSFILFMNLSAVEVNLHKTAINRAEREQHNRSSLAADAETRCMEASSDITEALRACRNMGPHDLNVFRQASALFTWATTIAAQAHLWMLGHGRGNRNTHISNLHVLSSVLRDYIGTEHLRPGLMSQIEVVLSGRGKDTPPGGRIPGKRPGTGSSPSSRPGTRI